MIAIMTTLANGRRIEIAELPAPATPVYAREFLIRWQEPEDPSLPPPAIAPSSRAMIWRELRVAGRSLMRGWTNTWPSCVPEGLPPAVHVAVVGVLAEEAVKAELRRLLS